VKLQTTCVNKAKKKHQHNIYIAEKPHCLKRHAKQTKIGPAANLPHSNDFLKNNIAFMFDKEKQHRCIKNDEDFPKQQYKGFF